MASPSQTTVLITGANGGIGRGLAEAFLFRPNHTVIGAVRNTSTTALKGYKPAEGSKLILVKIENSSPNDPAVEQLRSAGIDSLDLVISNAAINPVDALLNVEDMDIDKLRDILEVNTISYIRLFQATRPLLKAAAENQASEGAGDSPKLLAISSNAGSAVDMEPNIPARLGSYGVSKSALNYLVRRTHFENPWLTAWVMHPGFVQTDNGDALAQLFGMAQAPDTLARSVAGLLGRIDDASRVGTSGKFFDIDGAELAF